LEWFFLPTLGWCFWLGFWTNSLFDPWSYVTHCKVILMSHVSSFDRSIIGQILVCQMAYGHRVCHMAYAHSKVCHVAYAHNKVFHVAYAHSKVCHVAYGHNIFHVAYGHHICHVTYGYNICHVAYHMYLPLYNLCTYI